MKKILIFLLTVTIVSCNKSKDEIAADTFEVTTAGISLDCNLIIIKFKESDQDRIKKITNFDILSYEAYNLDKNNFSTQGMNLKVRVRKTADSEFFPCTRLGPTLPWVTVLEAEIK